MTCGPWPLGIDDEDTKREREGEQMQSLTAGGVRLECRWWGTPEGAGPALVLLHEGLGCVAMWRDFPALLHRRTGLRVFAWSRAGYGGSDPAALPRPIDYMHAEGREVVDAVLDAAGIEDAVLVGHSDGASIAMVHAGAHAHDPAPRARALVLLAPHVFCEEVSIAGIRAAGDAYRRGGLRERLARYHGERVDDTFFGWHDAWLQPAFRQWSIEAFLPGIAVPVLLVQGEHDAYGSVAQLDAIERGVAGPVTRRWLAECGHAPHRERPAETLDAIERFIAGSAPGG